MTYTVRIMVYTPLHPFPLCNDESSPPVKMAYSRVADVDITFDKTVYRGTTEVFDVIIASHACVEVTIASDVRGRLRRVVHHAQADAHNAQILRSHTITETEPKSSLNIPIKLTDADQILHISVTDLSLIPPSSSDKIIQLKDIRSLNDTEQSSVHHLLPAEDSTHTKTFLTSSFLK